eukprot:6190391-Pleurochrysis_carterae.AAC.2
MGGCVASRSSGCDQVSAGAAARTVSSGSKSCSGGRGRHRSCARGAVRMDADEVHRWRTLQ